MRLELICSGLTKLLVDNNYSPTTINFYKREWKKLNDFLLLEYGDDVFSIDWDLIVIDEAHEGIKTELGQKVLEALLESDKDFNTRQLHLSGTPFNLISDFESKDIYTWDYIMEQRAKKEWDIENFGDSNPYNDLPQMKIFTYDLGESLGIDKYNELGEKAFQRKK